MACSELASKHHAILGVAMIAAVVGCATIGPRPSAPGPERQYSAGSLPLLRQAVRAAPQDARRSTDLGIAYYEAATLDTAATNSTAAAESAIAFLDRARILGSTEPRSLEYLGKAYQLRGRDLEAITVFLRYDTLQVQRANQDPSQRVAMWRDRDRVLFARLKSESRVALQRERSLQARPPVPNSLAVPPFSTQGFPPGMEVFGRGMASLILYDLKKVMAIPLLERERLDVLLQELRLGTGRGSGAVTAGFDSTSGPITDIHGVKAALRALVRPSTGRSYYSGPADETRGADFAAAVLAFQTDRAATAIEPDGVPGPDTQQEILRVIAEMRQAAKAMQRGYRVPVDSTTAPYFGRLLKADRVVTGLLRLQGNDLESQLLIVPTESEAVVPATASGRLDRFVMLEKAIVLKIVAGIGIKLTPSQQAEIVGDQQTNSLAAMLAYSRGLEYRSTGEFDASYANFARAASIDPGFGDAARLARLTQPANSQARDANRVANRLLSTTQRVVPNPVTPSPDVSRGDASLPEPPRPPGGGPR